MARVKYNWGELDKVAKDFGLKMPEKKSDSNAVDKTARRQKFAKCRTCGGQMTYIKGTNALVCENLVEKTKKITNADGTVSTSVVNERCGAINLVADQYQSYMNFLFN